MRYWRDGKQDTALGHIAVVVGIVATIGRLDVAETFVVICYDTLERIHKANPESAPAARAVAVSCIKFLLFHRQRGEVPAAMQSLTACFA